MDKPEVATAIPTDTCAWDDTHELGVEVVIWREDVKWLGRPFARVFCSVECEEWYIDAAQPDYHWTN